MTERRAARALALPGFALGLALLPATGALAATGTFSASANGGNEVGKAGDTNATASGMFTADDSSGQFCYTVTGKSLTPAAMHIHKGASGVNGDVVIPLDAKKLGAGRTCTTASKTVLADIIANPAGYYFNAHTAAFPAGAVRGQLSAGGPSSVGAGTGGQASQNGGLPVTSLVLFVAGATLVGTAGRRLARR